MRFGARSRLEGLSEWRCWRYPPPVVGVTASARCFSARVTAPSWDAMCVDGGQRCEVTKRRSQLLSRPCESGPCAPAVTVSKQHYTSDKGLTEGLRFRARSRQDQLLWVPLHARSDAAFAPRLRTLSAEHAPLNLFGGRCLRGVFLPGPCSNDGLCDRALFHRGFTKHGR